MRRVVIPVLPFLPHFPLFSQVQITLSTHDCGGLSQRDITLATFIDQASLMWPSKHKSPKAGVLEELICSFHWEISEETNPKNTN